MKSSELAKLLSVFQRFIEGLPESQVRLLLDGRGELTLSTERDAPSEKRKVASAIVPSDVVTRLSECNVRQRGFEVLQPLSKNDLLLVSKHLDIHAEKSLSKDRIVEKIVERTVGARLRRSAIDTLGAN